MIARETIEAVLDRADIVQVIGDAVGGLARRGHEFVCCCPFHNEKTASFHVNPARGTWHCFGACQEGGDVISFVMKKEGVTFVEAVRQLAQRYGIDIDEESESSEEREARLRKEAMLGVNNRAAAWYAERLHDASDPDAVTALSYARNRWGNDYVEEAGMGFAPASGQAYHVHALAKGENPELLEACGLVKRNEQRGTYYDFYRNRLVIPIRDRMRRVIGFTARDLSGQSEAKYINSCESDAYHKATSVFGIDVGWREAVKRDLWYLVEGAPDAMRLHAVGFDNTAAPLGGAWTKEQLRMLAKASKCVCFLNDADPVKPGEAYGTGIGFVLKNGRTAMELGLTVSVREIACGEGNTKQDPDSYFKNAQMMDTLQEEEFVSWAARKMWKKDGNINTKSEVIGKIAELASFVTDDTRLEMIVDELVKLRKGKEFWRSNINRARWARMDAAKQRRGDVDLRTYGFIEDHGCYYGITDSGEVQWSNFTLRPLFHIRDEETPARLFELSGKGGVKELLRLDMDDLNSLQRFRKRLESMGNYIWMGGESEMVKLKTYLYDNTDTARAVTKMGWNAAGFYAFGNGLWCDGAFRQADKYGIVRTGDDAKTSRCWFLPAAATPVDADGSSEGGSYERERRFHHRTLGTLRFGEYMQKFVDVWGDNGRVGLLYWLASLFRDIVAGQTRSFPLLNLFGPKGTGKSYLGSQLMTFFVTGNFPPNLQNATMAALNDDVGYSANALVHFDEYKNSIRPQIVEFLKGTYDGVGRTKMGGNDFKERKMTGVKSGVIVSGQEMPTADIALFHRCIFLMFTKDHFSTEEKARLTDLVEIQKLGCTRYTIEALEQRQKVQTGFAGRYAEIARRMQDDTGGDVETRILENWAKMLAVFRSLEGRLDFPFTFEEVYELCLWYMKRQNELSGNSNELAHFWRTFMFLRDSGTLMERGDYLLKNYTTFKSETIERTFATPHPVLLVNISRVFNLYKEAARKAGDNVIPDDALREYIKHDSAFLGYVKAVRFTSFLGNVEEMRPDSSGVPRPVYRVTRAMAIDYDIVREKYGISLEASTIAAPGDEAGQDTQPPKPPTPKQGELFAKPAGEVPF